MDNKSNKLKESYETTVLEPYTAGFIKEDGSFIIADIYDDYIHGECSKEILDQHYPEFSNTHPEEDTCVRIMKEPNEIQYKKLEEIIDSYLDWEGYCKIEVWEVNDRNPHLYEVCSLFEGACQAYDEEEKVDNWTGYKLVQKIKNYFKGKLDEKIVHLSNGKWQVQSEKGRNMGTYDTKPEAQKRLGQVEYFKHLNEGSKGPIQDEKIKQYFYDCVEEMYKLKFWDNDFCLHYELINLEYSDNLNTLGMYDWPSVANPEGKIMLNIHTYNDSEESIKNTIYHELCHYVVCKWGIQKGVYIKSGYEWFNTQASNNDWSAHGRVWKWVADKVGRAIGQSITRTDDSSHIELDKHKEEIANYILKCKHCGREFKFIKKTDFVKSVLDGRGHTDNFNCICNDGFKGHDFEIVRNRK